MKIRKNVKASEEVATAADPVVLFDPCPKEDLMNVCDCKYQSAIDLISAAIESLAEIAKDDQVAKDSIANLGVVILDLKGNC